MGQGQYFNAAHIKYFLTVALPHFLKMAQNPNSVNNSNYIIWFHLIC